MMRADGRRSRAKASALAAYFLFAAAVASHAQDEDSALAHDCVNEIGLFCPGESGAALFDCLSAFRGSATARCRAHLKDVDASAPAAKVWASSAASVGPPPPAPRPVAPGFDFVARDEPRVERVGGARPKELIARMAASGLEESWDPGATLSFTFASAMKAGGCAVSAAHVQALTPRVSALWKEAPSAPAALAADWGRFTEALRDHEGGHKALAVKAGREFLSRLKALGARRTCAELDADARGLLARARLDARRADADYDARTARGRTQWEKLAPRAPANPDGGKTTHNLLK